MRKMARHGLVVGTALAVAGGLAFPAKAASTSFDCTSPEFADDAAICASPTLSELEALSTKGYYQALKASGKSKVKGPARRLLSERRKCLDDEPCIHNNLTEAIRTFQSLGATVVVPSPRKDLLAAFFGGDPVEEPEPSEADPMNTIIPPADTPDPAAGQEAIAAGLPMPSSRRPGFDASGGLTPEGQQHVFDMIKPSLVQAAGDEAFVAPPFAPRFMATGYLRESAGWLLFVNPTFGVVTFLGKDPVSRQMKGFGAVGAVELITAQGLRSRLGDGVRTRFDVLETALNSLLNEEKASPGRIQKFLESVDYSGDQTSNKLLLSGPILRSMNEEVRACYASIDEAKAAQQAAEDVARYSPDNANLSFFAVDLIPGPENDGVYVMTDQQTRTVYQLFPLTRSASGCALGSPTLIVNSL